MLPVISFNDQKIIYVADLIPSSFHVPIPWIMSYDMRPLKTMDEKSLVLHNAVKESHILFFEHDPIYEAAMVEQTEKGIRIKERGALSDFIQK